MCVMLALHVLYVFCDVGPHTMCIPCTNPPPPRSHEERLVDALRAAGAQVQVQGAGAGAGAGADTSPSPAPLAPPPPPLGTQLALAVHADVVMGQHGAGLAHALFAAAGCIVLEFKTVYGYQLDLFRLAAGASPSVHVMS